MIYNKINGALINEISRSGIGALPNVNVSLFESKIIDRTSTEAQYAQQMVELCKERHQLGFVLYVVDFFTLRWIFRSTQPATISRPFFIRCVVS